MGELYVLQVAFDYLKAEHEILQGKYERAQRKIGKLEYALRDVADMCNDAASAMKRVLPQYESWVCPSCEHYYEEPLHHPHCTAITPMMDISPYDGLLCQHDPPKFRLTERYKNPDRTVD